VAEVDTHLRFEPSDYYPAFGDTLPWLKPDAQRKFEAWEESFEFLFWRWEAERECWSELGWDVSETTGERLACMEHFGRPIVCVVDELLSDAKLSLTGENEAVSANQWGRSLEADAKRFLASKPGQRR
jgi:hypothetical protein